MECPIELLIIVPERVACRNKSKASDNRGGIDSISLVVNCPAARNVISVTVAFLTNQGNNGNLLNYAICSGLLPLCQSKPFKYKQLTVIQNWNILQRQILNSLEFCVCREEWYHTRGLISITNDE